MQKLPALLDAFAREIPGVKEGRDIEYIHRMRVASRRLRAALPLFAPCFPAKEYGAWMRELTRITRALGEARDTDVQIAFLRKLEKKPRPRPASRIPQNIPWVSPESPAARYLLSALEKKRARLQNRVLASLGRLEKSGVISTMQAEFARRVQEFRSIRKRPLLHGVPALAAYRISSRLSRLLSYEQWIRHPEAVAEHHATRIAAKKLRYTMEIYGALYRNGLKKHLARVKKVQEILGDIHDCDVWIDHVTQLILRERTLLRSSRVSQRPDTATLTSLRIFLHNRETERMQLYRRFIRFWDSLARSGLWTDLIGTLDSGRRVRYLPPPLPPENEALAAVTAFAGEVPGIADHSRQVARLALGIYDSLAPLQGPGSLDRLLLETAGLLHDIGLGEGRNGHSRRGALAVFTSEFLPFDLQERAIVSVAVACHRGRADPESLPAYSLLQPENRNRALVLAAILRIADGFDFRHTGAVRNVRCTRVSDKVFIDAEGDSDIAAEKERARLKGDIFARVFSSRPVIR
jgi:CHAD domain-containing protein